MYTRQGEDPCVGGTLDTTLDSRPFAPPSTHSKWCAQADARSPSKVAEGDALVAGRGAVGGPHVDNRGHARLARAVVQARLLVHICSTACTVHQPAHTRSQRPFSLFGSIFSSCCASIQRQPHLQLRSERLDMAHGMDAFVFWTDLPLRLAS
jgi:hypothetical protein